MPSADKDDSDLVRQVNELRENLAKAEKLVQRCVDAGGGNCA